MLKKLLFVVNPCAGQKKAARNLSGILEVFCAGGYMPTVMMTAKAGHATEIAREYAAGFDLVACAGGDGTLNEVITGILEAGAKTPISYLPCGTTNDLGATLGLNRDLIKAAGDAVDGQSRFLDIGRFNGRHFVYTASFGAFTKASYATPQAMKNVLGHLAYVLEGMKELWQIKPVCARIETDAGAFEGEYIFGSITNSTSLAGILTIDKNQVNLDDGLFEMMLVEKPKNAIEYSKLLSQIAQKRFDDKLRLHKISHAEFRTDEPIRWTLDGEQSDKTDSFIIDNIKNAIEFRIP